MRRRLVIGASATALVTAACVVGPLALPRLPGHDPARSALLPPLTVVTVATLADGAVVVSPQIEVGQREIRVRGRTGWTPVPRHMVVSLRTHRFVLGSDRYGRDILWHLLAGGRVSLAVAAVGALVALLAGGVVGLAAATSGRVVDTVLMRSVDALLAFPVLFLMILAAALVQPNAALLATVLGLTSWMGLARLVRGQAMALRTRPFVLAGRTAGSRGYRIWSLHYVPNMAGPLSQDTALRLGDLVIAEATLSYLGLGVPPTTPTWGSMVAEGHAVMPDAWWLTTFPGLAIACLVISLALVGDGLQSGEGTGG